MGEDSLAYLSAEGWGVSKLIPLIPHSPTTHAEKYPEDLSAIAEGVDQEVDAAVDGEEEVTNEEQLGADGNFLTDINLVLIPKLR